MLYSPTPGHGAAHEILAADERVQVHRTGRQLDAVALAGDDPLQIGQELVIDPFPALHPRPLEGAQAGQAVVGRQPALQLLQGRLEFFQLPVGDGPAVRRLAIDPLAETAAFGDRRQVGDGEHLQGLVVAALALETLTPLRVDQFGDGVGPGLFGEIGLDLHADRIVVGHPAVTQDARGNR